MKILSLFGFSVLISSQVFASELKDYYSCLKLFNQNQQLDDETILIPFEGKTFLILNKDRVAKFSIPGHFTLGR